MIPDLKDKVVLITGASTGIGAAVARAFGAEGSTVVVHYHASEAAAHAVVAAIEAGGGHAHALRADATRPEQLVGLVKSTVDRYGRLDVLINNVGDLVQRCPIADSTEELFDAVVDLNVRSVVTTSRAAIAQFRAQGGGAIINTTSIAARNGGGPGSVLYASSKAFVSTLTRGLAKELAKDNIRVNGVGAGRHHHAAAGASHQRGTARGVSRCRADGPARQRRGVHRRVSLPGLERAERLRHRPDSRGQRRAADALSNSGN